MYDSIIKRVLDLIFAPLLIMILSPIYIIISLLVLAKMGRPIIFKQERVGKNNRIFKMYKFRSMKNSSSSIASIEDDHNRLTKFGIFLRSTSLDELPELFNILKGDMSFVGPRPFPAYYLPFYTKNELKRHDVRGGLIPCDGLSGKTDISWEEQFQVENYYIRNLSFFLDLKVIFKTLKILLVRVKGNYGAIERPLLNEYRIAPQNDIYRVKNEE